MSMSLRPYARAENESKPDDAVADGQAIFAPEEFAHFLPWDRGRIPSGFGQTFFNGCCGILADEAVITEADLGGCDCHRGAMIRLCQGFGQ